MTVTKQDEREEKKTKTSENANTQTHRKHLRIVFSIKDKPFQSIFTEW